jgi:rRNA maturation endonuclease Nob1
MKKTVTINGKKFEVPGGKLYCKKCKSVNFIYDDMKPPYFCADCGKPLKAETMEEIDIKEGVSPLCGDFDLHRRSRGVKRG